MPTASESHANRIAIQKQKHSQNVPSSLRSDGAQAPLRTSEVIRRYAQVVAKSGRPEGFSNPAEWARAKDALAGQVKRLISRDRWPAELVLRAVENYARRRRNPYFVGEWIRLEYADEREAAHVARKESEPRDGGMRAIAAAMKELGL